MSTSCVSCSSGPAPLQTPNNGQQISQDFKQLSGSLQSGDLAGAQQAYSSLQQLLPNQAQNGQSTNPIISDFKALGQALGSGDLGSAQSAFSQLQSDVKAAGGGSPAAANVIARGVGGHGHHHVQVQANDDDTASTSAPTSSSSTTTNTNYSGTNGSLVNVLG